MATFAKEKTPPYGDVLSLAKGTGMDWNQLKKRTHCLWRVI